jgi:hypothetical protein
MRSAKSIVLTLLFLLTGILATSLVIALLSANVSAKAEDGGQDEYVSAKPEDGGQDEYDETARVVRISLLQGEVSVQRAGEGDWEKAQINVPLLEGDTLATGSDARVEVQVDARNFIRVGANSVLKLVTLRDNGIAFSLAGGKASFRLARFELDREYFEVDAPQTTMAAQKQGLYRLDVASEGKVRITVRDGGSARIYSTTSGFTLRDGRSAELVHSGSDEGDWELAAASPLDDWDQWNAERESYLASRLRYENRQRYYDAEVFGAEDLDSYGDWSYASDYGWIWRPNSTVVNSYADWVPYRHGYWTWCSPYGWTWVGDEPWGWAPYHYGRWVYYNNYWCWAPRGFGYGHRRSWWRPALVAFVFVPTSFGEQVCWYPLGYGQRDPRGRLSQNTSPYTPYTKPRRSVPLGTAGVGKLQRINPVHLRAVSTSPAGAFGQRTTPVRPAPTDLAKRVADAEPVRGTLPIRPAPAPALNAPSGTGTQAGNKVAAPARPLTAGPIAPAATRLTGAGTRVPGTPLDNELRRTRVFNGRDTVPTLTLSRPTTGSNSTPTGAVARPPRPTVHTPVERNSYGEGANTGGGRSTLRISRPAPPNSPVERQPAVDTRERPARTDGKPATHSRPSTPSDSAEGVPPARVDRPERGARSEAPPARIAPSAPSRQQTEAPRHESAPAPSRHEAAPSHTSEAPARSSESKHEDTSKSSSSKDEPSHPSHH